MRQEESRTSQLLVDMEKLIGDVATAILTHRPERLDSEGGGHDESPEIYFKIGHVTTSDGYERHLKVIVGSRGDEPEEMLMDRVALSDGPHRAYLLFALVAWGWDWLKVGT